MSVIRVVALVTVVNGLVNPNRYLAERVLKFDRIAIYESIGACVNAGAAIVLAWIWRDVTALAWGLVAAGLFNSALSYVLFPIPRLRRPGRASVFELVSVGRYFIVLSIGGFLMTQGDNLAVGAVLGLSLIHI